MNIGKIPINTDKSIWQLGDSMGLGVQQVPIGNL